MVRKPIDAFWDRENLYNVNSNFDELFNVVDALKDMSLSLVNDGKLTDKQFQDLQITLNDLVKKVHYPLMTSIITWEKLV
ncbi:hypothetical protein DWB90_08840 [Staphylococcus chromogenes]|nr:hypothetical protein DWB90_08840 [Staphylococcus chromogenes]